MRQPKHAVVTLAAVLAALPALALEAPRPVSPAVAGGVATVSTGCPSFSWTSADGAEGYELLVYRLEAGEPAGEPVVREALPAGASSWTPTAERCLEAGAAYGWVVRTVGGEGADWSKPALFEVALPSRAEVAAALETLRRYLEGEPELQGAVPPSLTGPSEEAHQRPEVLETDGVAAVVTPLEMRLLEERLALVEPKGHSSGSAAIHAVEPSTSGVTYGVWGESRSTQGIGVLGWTPATSGFTYGVFARSDSTHGTGVLGVNFATSGGTVGVLGQSNSTQGIGVLGAAAAGSGINYGVYGYTNSAQGYAGYFDGRVHVTGALTKGSGSFKIDHPLDPANKFLSHSFVESPEMLNVYDGNVTLDETGSAWVELPAYFEALNREFRYQLTPLRRPAPGLYIAETIAGNRFRIAGGDPGMEVSWQVTGIRKDAYAERNPIVVEEDKGELAGRYLHPEAFGLPRELAIGRLDAAATELAELAGEGNEGSVPVPGEPFGSATLVEVGEAAQGGERAPELEVAEDR